MTRDPIRLAAFVVGGTAGALLVNGEWYLGGVMALLTLFLFWRADQ